MAAIDDLFPRTDPTPIFDHFRSHYAADLLTTAVVHLGFFEAFSAEAVLEVSELQRIVGLENRAFVVLLTALRAMGLATLRSDGNVELTPMAREHLLPKAPFDISGYLSLSANSPGVLGMVERLRTNCPSGADTITAGDPGTTHTYRAGTSSALEAEETARRSTFCLAGRARNVAPYLAREVDVENARVLLDVGAGSGIYAFALLRKCPQLRAILLDRPEVLRVAAEYAGEWGVADRVELLDGDLLKDTYPQADLVLFSNVLHDWDVEDCAALVRRGAASLSTGGRILIHDVFLNDSLDGPLPVALYSALLFSLSEGRAYSAEEYRAWLREAGLTPRPVRPTLVHCGVLEGIKET